MGRPADDESPGSATDTSIFYLAPAPPLLPGRVRAWGFTSLACGHSDVLRLTCLEHALSAATDPRPTLTIKLLVGHRYVVARAEGG